MTRAVGVREFSAPDAPAVSALIRATLFGSNAADYPADLLESIAEWNGPEALIGRIAHVTRLVAEVDGAIVGTVARNKDRLVTFFVAPDSQRLGVGTRLLTAIEEGARQAGVRELRLDSSVTAEPFYTARGYVASGPAEDNGDGPVVPMGKLV